MSADFMRTTPNHAQWAFGTLSTLLLILALLTPTAIAIAACVDGDSSECSPQPRLRSQVGQYDVTGAILDQGPKGFTTAIGATSRQLPIDPTQSLGVAGSSSAPVVANGYCWHDDHAFLPPGAQSGISCGSQTTADTPDPHQVALSLFDHLDLPDLRIDMNPRLGMVAVPTWFWVEGYNGDVIPLNTSLRLPRQECHERRQP